LSLPEDFSERVMLPSEIAVRCSAQRDVKRGFISSQRLAVRQKRRGQIIE